MSYKFIQVNIYQGKYLDNLVQFIKSEKPDFVSMQEVSAFRENLCNDKNINLFDYLKKELFDYGVFAADFALAGDTKSVSGKAVFSRFPIKTSKVLTLKKFELIPKEKRKDEGLFPFYPRNMIDASVEVLGKTIHVLSWHGAWTAPPTDTNVTLEQASKVKSYLEVLKEPFVLGCDANAIMGSETIALVESAAKNQMRNLFGRQTTHPKVHKIVPRGYLVDYVFTSPTIKVDKVDIPDVLVSDHLPVVAELAI